MSERLRDFDFIEAKDFRFVARMFRAVCVAKDNNSSRLKRDSESVADRAYYPFRETFRCNNSSPSKRDRSSLNRAFVGFDVQVFDDEFDIIFGREFVKSDRIPQTSPHHRAQKIVFFRLDIFQNVSAAFLVKQKDAVAVILVVWENEIRFIALFR